MASSPILVSYNQLQVYYGFGNNSYFIKYDYMFSFSLNYPVRKLNLQGGAWNVIPLIVHVTHFYYYKNILHLVQN